MIKALEKYLKIWKLSSPQKIASTHTSDVYKVLRSEETFILKLLNEKGQVCEKEAPKALACFAGKSSVRLVEFDELAQLLEYVDGEKLSQVVKKGEDLKASKIIADVLASLHGAVETKELKVPSLEDNFRSLFERGKKSEKGSIFYKTLSTAEDLLRSEESKTLLHGDIHHDNILFSSSRGWLAIDPQPLYGERTYDFANCFFNPDDCPTIVEEAERLQKMASVFSQALEIEPSRILKFAFAHGGLSMSWQLDEGEAPGRRLRISKLLEKILNT